MTTSKTMTKAPVKKTAGAAGNSRKAPLEHGTAEFFKKEFKLVVAPLSYKSALGKKIRAKLPGTLTSPTAKLYTAPGKPGRAFACVYASTRFLDLDVLRDLAGWAEANKLRVFDVLTADRVAARKLLGTPSWAFVVEYHV